MEPQFQTSFIPKKNLTPSGLPSRPSHHYGGGILMFFAVLVLVVSLAAAGGAYVWNQILLSNQNSYKQQLAVREQQFNIDLIQQLKQTNTQIDTAKQLLANHLALSQIFDVIGHFTVADIRFLSLDLTGPTSPGGDITLSMNGYGANLSTVAFQSDVLGSLEQYGLRNVVKNPIISDPVLGANGTVSFGFTAAVDSSALSYEDSITNGGVFASMQDATGTPDTATGTPSQ